MPKFLCFADAHVEPGMDNARFSWLGELIVNERPDYVVQLGDFVSMNSLSHWDRNKRLLMEGRRYLEDIEAGYEALSSIVRPLYSLQTQQRVNKKKIYKPKLIWCEGNHEEWTQRYVELHPELQGQLKTFSPDFVSHMFSETFFVPYKEYMRIGNVAFTHVPIAANARPVSGKYATHRALDLFDCSVVFGHTHKFEVVNRYQHGGGKMKQAIACGCFFDHQPLYSKGAQNSYFRTAVILESREDGLFDVNTTYWK